MSADKLLTDAAQIMQERAKQYDSPTGERSMGKAVAAFNCVTGNKMTEAEGWLLLQLLNDVRQWTTPNVAHVDSLQDCIAYAALKAECIIEQNASDAEWQDKELPSSGIYGESGYTDQDMQAASLVHDAELNPDLVDLCSKTEIHADKYGWIAHAGNNCPITNGKTRVETLDRRRDHYQFANAEDINWHQSGDVAMWRYANKEQ